MRLKGSFTIEASLLLPLIIGTIVLLLYMSFFLHDKAVITEGAAILANKYTNEKKLSNQEIKQRLQSDSENIILAKVIATKNISTNINVENKKITVTCSGTFEFPKFTITQTVFRRDMLSISASKTMKRANPVKYIRKARIVEALLKN